MTGVHSETVVFEPPRGLKPAARRVLGCTFIACVLVISAIGGCTPRRVPEVRKPVAPKARRIRAIWVTRWDYKSKRDIVHIMENCRDAGFNTILFQVRGNGTAFYRSSLEPWADELGGRYPGFDPLEVACREAHRRGLSLHAWVNVIPGWRGKKPPKSPKQLYNAHRNWFWRDASGRYQPLGWYVSVNPCYPEVRKYLVDVMREIVERYPVDGLHMDYIRFPNEWNESYPAGAPVPDYPRDPRTLAMFRRATGSDPDSSPEQWRRWRTAQINRLVYDIRKMLRRVKPKVMLSAAVTASFTKAKSHHFQDAAKWIADGLVDAVFPMNYASDLATFDERLKLWSPSARRIPVVTGIMFDKRDAGLVIAQMNRAVRTGGHFSAFAYNSLFARLDSSGSPKADGQSSRRAALQRQVIPRMRKLAASEAAHQRRAAGRLISPGPHGSPHKRN